MQELLPRRRMERLPRREAHEEIKLRVLRAFVVMIILIGSYPKPTPRQL
jgi:hypothetical protein